MGIGNYTGIMPLVPKAAEVLLLHGWPAGRLFLAGGVVSHASIWSAPATRSLLQYFDRLDRKAGNRSGRQTLSESLLHTLA